MTMRMRMTTMMT
jgi:hypothetical protein